MRIGRGFGAVVALVMLTPVFAASGEQAGAGITSEVQEVLAQVFERGNEPLMVAALSREEMRETRGSGIRISPADAWRLTGDPGVIDLFVLDSVGPRWWAGPSDGMPGLDTAAGKPL